MTLDEIIQSILAKRREVAYRRSVLVGVSGIDGSGKGYITHRLAEMLQGRLKTAAINIDPWLVPPEERYNPDDPARHFYERAFPFEDLFNKLVLPLRDRRSLQLSMVLTGQSGRPETQVYDYADIDVILLEGIFLFKRALRSHFDLAFWIECSTATALERALKRNQEDLPPDLIVRDYHAIYFPAQAIHATMDNPKAGADGIYLNE